MVASQQSPKVGRLFRSFSGSRVAQVRQVARQCSSDNRDVVFVSLDAHTTPSQGWTVEARLMSMLVALWYSSVPPNGQMGHVRATYLSAAEAPGARNLVDHVASLSVYNIERLGSDRTKNRILVIFSKSSKCTPLT